MLSQSTPPYASYYETEQIKTVLTEPKLQNYNSEYQQRFLLLHFKLTHKQTNQKDVILGVSEY